MKNIPHGEEPFDSKVFDEFYVQLAVLVEEKLSVDNNPLTLVDALVTVAYDLALDAMNHDINDALQHISALVNICTLPPNE